MTLTADTQAILDKIHKHGYWRVVIRPTQFEPARVPRLKQCEEFVTSSAVRLRGWDYPHATRVEVARGGDWVESMYDGTSNWRPFIEYWRFFQSGQFVHHFACHEDNQDLSPYVFPSEARQAIRQGQPCLSIIGSLFTLTEIFEFAARMAQRGVLVPSAEISITLFGMKGRIPVFVEPRIPPLVSRSSIDTIEYPSQIVSMPELLARAPELALDAAEWILERFNLTLSRDLLSQDQQRLLQRNL